MDNTADSHPLKDSTQDVDTHLWIPEPESTDSTSERLVVPSSSRTPQLLRERLYIGNLSSAVDEYSLLQVFSRFGKVSKFDFLFHKSGPNKGKPRGYAFIEYMNEADAAKALQSANGKLLRGRKLVVTFAQQAPSHDSGSTSHGVRGKRADATPTALSMVKSSGIARPEAKTSNKIAIMEAKLRQMESSSPFTERPTLPPKPFTASGGSSNGLRSQRTRTVGSTAASTKHLAIHRPTGSRGPKNESGKASSERSAASSSVRETEGPNLMGLPISNKQRSIPGVKIVKGGSNKGATTVTPPTERVSNDQ